SAIFGVARRVLLTRTSCTPRFISAGRPVPSWTQYPPPKERAMERSTAQRKAIHIVLERAGRPLSPPEIYGEARSMAPGLGMATVYRTLKRLLDEKTISPVELPGEAPRYDRSGMQHHHHVRCTACCSVFDCF